MFGRLAERDRLRAAWQATVAGRVQVVGVVGPAGIGKSTLLLHLDLDDCTILRSTGSEANRHVPWSGAHQMLYPLLGDLTSLPTPQRTAVEHVFALADSPAPNVRFAAMAGALSLVERAASQRPVALLVDDAQWLDEATIETIAFLALRLRDVPVLIAVAARELPAVIDETVAEHIELRGLSEIETLSVVRELDAATSASTARAVHRAADGNPLAALELLGALTVAERRGTDPLPTAIPPVGSVSELFRGRLASLSADCRVALALVALAGPRTVSELEHLLRAAGMSRLALRPAVDAQLISLRPSVVWAHPLIRSVVVEDAPMERLREAAHAAAAVVEDVARRAWMLEAVAEVNDPIACAALVDAARSAEAAGAHLEAGSAWEQAAHHSVAEEEQRFRLAAFNSFVLGAAARDATRCVAQLIADAPDEQQLVDRRADQAMLMSKMRLGGYDSSIAAAFAEGSTVNPSAAVRGLLACSQQAYMNVDITAARRLTALAREIDPASPQIAMTNELFDWFAGDRRPETLLDAPWEAMLDDAQALTGELPLDAVIVLLCHVEQFDRAERVLAKLLRVLGEHNALGVLGSTLIAQAELALRRGDWTIARTALAEAAELHSLFGWDAAVPNALLIGAYLDAAQGHHDESAAAIAHARSMADGTVPVLGFGLRAEAMNALGRADHHGAASAWDQLAALTETVGMNPTGYGTWRADAVDVLVWLGRRSDAQRYVETLDRDAARFAWLRTPRAAALWAHGVLEPAGGADGIVEGAEMLDGLGLRFDAARAFLAAGAAQRRGRRRGAARQSLGRAHATFVDLGAAPWMAMAAQELALSGGTPRTAIAAAQQLTSQESRVAALVADGLTNAEVATRLFISRRTVEYHLVHVYRKTGVPGRDALATALQLR